jgi:hypothetical protein
MSSEDYETYILTITRLIYDYGFNKCIIPICVILNIIILVIYLSKDLRKYSVSFWYCTHALTDLSYFVVKTFYDALINGNTFSTIACCICGTLLDVISIMHIYSLVCANIDRLIFICYPNKLKFIKNTWLQLLVVFSFISFGIVLYTPYDLTLTFISSEDALGCWYSGGSIDFIYSWINFSILGVIPTIIMFTCTILLTRTIRQSKKRVTQSSNQSVNNREPKFAMYIIICDTVFIGSSFVI